MKHGSAGSAVPQRKHAVVAAFQFLSRFPVKMQLDFVPPLLRESVVYYPLVGAAIGLLGGYPFPRLIHPIIDSALLSLVIVMKLFPESVPFDHPSNK